MAALYCSWSCWQYYVLKLIEPYEDRWDKLFAASNYLKKQVYHNALKNYIRLKKIEDIWYYHTDESMCLYKKKLNLKFLHYDNFNKLLYKFSNICNLIQNEFICVHNNNICSSIYLNQIYIYEYEVIEFFRELYNYFVKILSFLYELQENGQYLHYQNEMLMNEKITFFKNSCLFHMCWLMQRLLMYYPSSLCKTPESLLILSARSIYCRGGGALWQLRYTIDTLHMPSKLHTFKRKWSDDEVLNEFIKHYKKQKSHLCNIRNFDPTDIAKHYLNSKFGHRFQNNICANEISFINKYRLN
ncbi:hypothetical protein [Choristoneura rosaceana nucleopolyhedrovirus]|uniref:Uncharacterized protein n=1 Tax=Choristoneura rosaceana nucleopolyhedrovirus TaxID=58094 RepID=S5MR97_9ABAC|nr:hypothetical protein [Choristoneura rosaceana nucleopolyhedrovirus]AGR57094.1 hypothetical protein [Choristoneura rosaceana nucleopolyhedrovirus]